MQRMLRMLAEADGEEVSTNEIAAALDLPKGASSVAGMAGAIGRRVNSRYGMGGSPLGRPAGATSIPRTRPRGPRPSSHSRSGYARSSASCEARATHPGLDRVGRRDRHGPSERCRCVRRWKAKARGSPKRAPAERPDAAVNLPSPSGLSDPAFAPSALRRCRRRRHGLQREAPGQLPCGRPAVTLVAPRRPSTRSQRAPLRPRCATAAGPHQLGRPRRRASPSVRGWPRAARNSYRSARSRAPAHLAAARGVQP
jgi:hypothetical protein